MGRPKSYKKINAVILTVDVLDFVASHGPCTGRQVSEGIEVNYVTAMTHLETLKEVGLLKKEGDLYDIGMRMAAFWAKVRRRNEDARDQAIQNLKEIGAA